MRLLVHSFLLAVGFACTFVDAYHSQALIQQPFEIATAPSVSYTRPSSHDDVISTPSRASVAEPTPLGMQLRFEVVHDDQTNGVNGQAPSPSPSAEFPFLSDDAFVGSNSVAIMSNGTTDIINTDGSASKNQDGGASGDGVTGIAHALPPFGGVVITVVTFACLESLLSYVMTGKTPLGLVSGRIKSAR